ncbi:hypothetical protein HMPREF0541_02715, partial [Lacticaseibacillus rhamnosus ATCC 21052]
GRCQINQFKNNYLTRYTQNGVSGRCQINQFKNFNMQAATDL